MTRFTALTAGAAAAVAGALALSAALSNPVELRPASHESEADGRDDDGTLDQGPGDRPATPAPSDAPTEPDDDATAPDDATEPDDEATEPDDDPTAAPAPTTRTFDAAGAGQVSYRFDGVRFELVAAVPADGWTVDVEQAVGDEIDLDFRCGTARVQVDVELEDGGIRERVRVRDDADDSEVRIENGTVVRTEGPDDDPTDEPDDDGDDHHSGPGSGGDDEDDDHSGPGDGDDDSSGSGSDDDDGDEDDD